MTEHDETHAYGSTPVSWFHVLGRSYATKKQVGKYCVSFKFDTDAWLGSICSVRMAVVDDFGNLVAVPS